MPLKAVFEEIGETPDLSEKQAHVMVADLVSTLTTHPSSAAVSMVYSTSEPIRRSSSAC
ncbi:MAG: hypothetical protein P4L90_05945 [Rhodopila sp.]|nr:hypothetical protein [Rhodopila sp.]